MNQHVNKKSLDNLKDMCEGGNFSLIHTLVNMYMTSTPSEVKQMSLYLQGGDIESLCRAAHSLKSSSGNLGIEVIREACSNIEKKTSGAVELDVLYIEKQISIIKDSFPDVYIELAQYAKDLKQ